MEKEGYRGQQNSSSKLNILNPVAKHLPCFQTVEYSEILVSMPDCDHFSKPQFYKLEWGYHSPQFLILPGTDPESENIATIIQNQKNRKEKQIKERKKKSVGAYTSREQIPRFQI